MINIWHIYDSNWFYKYIYIQCIHCRHVDTHLVVFFYVSTTTHLLIWLGDCPGSHGVPGAVATVAMDDGNVDFCITIFVPRLIKCCYQFFGEFPCVFHIVYWSTVSSKLLQLCICTPFSTGCTAPWYPRHQARAQGIKIVTLWDFQPSDFSWLNHPCVDGMKSTCLTTKYPLLLNRVIAVINENQIRFLQFGGSNP